MNRLIGIVWELAGLAVALGLVAVGLAVVGSMVINWILPTLGIGLIVAVLIATGDSK